MMKSSSEGGWDIWSNRPRRQKSTTAYLRKRVEVIGLMLALFDSQEVQNMYEESIKEEGRAEGIMKGRAEGIVKGRAEGMIRTLCNLVKKRRMTPDEAAEEAGLTLEEFKKRASLLMSEKETAYQD